MNRKIAIVAFAVAVAVTLAILLIPDPQARIEDNSLYQIAAPLAPGTEPVEFLRLENGLPVEVCGLADNAPAGARPDKEHQETARPTAGADGHASSDKRQQKQRGDTVVRDLGTTATTEGNQASDNKVSKGITSTNSNSDRKPNRGAVAADPFLENVHDLVDEAGVLYETMEQTPGAIIPELAMLDPIDWVKLAEKHQDVSTPQRTMEAIAETRVRAKSKFFTALSGAYGMASLEESQTPATDLAQLKRNALQSVPDTIWERYEIPDRSEWPAIIKQWAPDAKYGPPQLIVREKQSDWSGPDGQAAIIFFEKHQAEINGVRLLPSTASP